MKICRDAPAGARCSANLFGAEQPDKKIGISPYEIDKFEVTNADYEACVDAKACTAARYSTTCGGEDKAIKSNEHPVVCVTHKDADKFCRWADKRLPTEAEWEFAARGDKDARAFPWGDDWKPKWANWGDKGSDDGHKYTSPVGDVSKDESPFGAMDMGGNVSEWVSDGFGKKFYGEDKALNPVNVKDTKERTIRGGNWESGGHTVRVSFRSGLNPDKFNGTTGFRCARTK